MVPVWPSIEEGAQLHTRSPGPCSLGSKTGWVGSEWASGAHWAERPHMEGWLAGVAGWGVGIAL